MAEEKKAGMTRRDFLIHSNASAVAIGVVGGGGLASTIAAEPQATSVAAVAASPMKTRRVTLDIDGNKEDVTVDVRDSLWETMNYQMGLSNSNLGCDRAQCGACAIVVDGRAVNSCTILSARYGRGQKILTVGGITSGPGLQGLHPLQRAFWLEGGFQCGICTRGFIIAAYALMQTNRNPTTEEIKEAVSGNICRCGEYAKIFTSVNVAAAELRGETVSHLATPVLVGVAGTKEAAPSAPGTSKEFQFERPMTTIEDFEPFEANLKKRDGILAVSGSERAVTIKWDPAKLDEAKVRQIVRELNWPVR